jgi:hypothetical protein
MTWENNFWYTRVTSNGGPCSDEELDSDDMSINTINYFIFYIFRYVKKSHEDCLRLQCDLLV